MANLSNNVKTAFLKGLQALGKTASNLTDAAQQKLSEMNLDTRRREVLAEIPKCVMQMWKNGVEMPEPLNNLLQELTELEEKLAALRPQPEVKPEETVEEEAPAAEEEAPAEEETAEEVCEEAVSEESACECAEEECACAASEETLNEEE